MQTLQILSVFCTNRVKYPNSECT
uniref:Uncharacterized protein n=1 Tax=Arundo donax TaxID=35708 RepID=A0A0A9AMG4_ARUDO